MQLVVAAQEIAVSVGPHLTLGSEIRFHVWPLNCSAAAICRPVAPTAMQKRLETHEDPAQAAAVHRSERRRTHRPRGPVPHLEHGARPRAASEPLKCLPAQGVGGAHGTQNVWRGA